MPTTRVDPIGNRLKDGHRCLVAFAADPDVSFWERTVKPPGFNGGEPINTVTMFNDAYVTKSPQALIDVTDMTIRAAYDPRIYDQIKALINVLTLVTVLFPDGSTLEDYGWLRVFEPGDIAIGAMTECTITVTWANEDPSGDEYEPEWLSATGTG